MALYHSDKEKSRQYEEYALRDEEMLGNIGRSSDSLSPKNQLEQEKRLRREIANSNERRRMQSINAGFNSLKSLIPHHEGEKLSKAAILQQTADYISSLMQEKSRLLSQNSRLKRMLGDIQCNDSDSSIHSSPPPKRKKRDTESSDEGINIPAEDTATEEMKRELIELRCQLDRERHLRVVLEDQNRNLQTQMFPERRIRHIANQVTAQMRHQAFRQAYIESDRLLSKFEEDDVKPHMHHEPLEAPTCRSPPQSHETGFLNSYLSRRNLDMIVEAIRHLEGDHVLHDRPDAHRDIANSEESEKESSVTLSDHEDCKSDSSGRDSPTFQPSQVQATVHVQHSHLLNTDRLTKELLHRPALAPQFLQRPGVIVQKSS